MICLWREQQKRSKYLQRSRSTFLPLSDAQLHSKILSFAVATTEGFTYFLLQGNSTKFLLQTEQRKAEVAGVKAQWFSAISSSSHSLLLVDSPAAASKCCSTQSTSCPPPCLTSGLLTPVPSPLPHYALSQVHFPGLTTSCWRLELGQLPPLLTEDPPPALGTGTQYTCK